MKISAIITKPFFKHSKLFVFAAIFAASLIAGTNIFAQNEDAPKGKKEPELTSTATRILMTRWAKDPDRRLNLKQDTNYGRTYKRYAYRKD